MGNDMSSRGQGDYRTRACAEVIVFFGLVIIVIGVVLLTVAEPVWPGVLSITTGAVITVVAAVIAWHS